MKLFIGCSSSDQIPQKYLKDCEEYLKKVLKNQELVFGACPTGLMGISYRIAKEYQEPVTGICPEAYKEDLQYLDCETEVLTTSISDRTDKAVEYSDALIFLPGGIGTIYEFMTAVESKRNHEFDKPIILYNSHHFFDKQLECLEKIYQEGFTGEKVKKCYHVSDSAEDTLEYLGIKKRTYHLMTAEGKIIESMIPGTIGGNKKLKIYGKIDCPSAKRWIEKGYYKKNRVFFPDEETAKQAGYRPCACCMREEYQEWKSQKTK